MVVEGLKSRRFDGLFCWLSRFFILAPSPLSVLARGRRVERTRKNCWMEEEVKRNWSSGGAGLWSLTSWVVVMQYKRDHTIKGLDTIHPLVF